jgi:hypothetical protein
MKLWEIESNRPVLIERSKLDFEERLEDWIVEDISLVSSNLLVIGRQVPTDYGGSMDLLAIDQDGNLVILELKRHKTPRDIVAQILDYASWVEGLGATKIEEIADSYLNNGPLETAFKSKFQIDLPEVLNERHRMYVVASEIDASSERIVRYLSEYHNVDINIATFSFFRTEDRELVGKSFLLDETEVENRAKSRSKRKPPLTLEELQEIAEQKGVGDLYKSLVEGLTNFFDQRTTTRSTVAFIGVFEESRNTIFSLVPGECDSEQGVRFTFYSDRILEYLNASKDDLIAILPSNSEETRQYRTSPDTFVGFFKDSHEVDHFLAGLNALMEG